MSYGLKRGTRHYIQYDLEGNGEWRDLNFVNDEGQMQGLWSSRSYGRANARIEELMAEADTTRDQYRIVRRTWDEEIIQHDPNYGKAFNDPSLVDPSEDDDSDTDAFNASTMGDPDTDQSAEDDANVTEIIETAQAEHNPLIK